MLTSGEMCAAVAAALGLPEPTVGVYARHLREAGLLSQAGRGRGAARMKPLDYGRLVIALLATDSPARAVAAARDFGPLELLEAAVTDGAPEGLDLALFGADPAAGLHFEDAVGAVVCGFANPAVMARLREFEVFHESPLGPYLPPVIVSARESKVAGEIKIGGRTYTFALPIVRDDFSYDKIMLGDEEELSALNSFNEADEKITEIKERWVRRVRVTRTITTVELVDLGNRIAG